jgi:succinylglutamate desuccinylase
MAERLTIERGEAPGVLWIAPDPSFPPPRVAVMGSIHGDEPAGGEVLERVERQAREGSLGLERGTLIVVHGNLRAKEQRRRYTKGGADLNRLFDWRFEQELPRERWAYEHHRALELAEAVHSAEILLDLHTAFSETSPFAIVNEIEGSLGLAHRLGLPFVSRGWFGQGLLGDSTSIGLFARRGLPAIAVECGQHDRASAREVGHACVRRFLGALELTSEPAPDSGAAVLDLLRPVVRPSHQFRFERPIHGLDHLPAGTVLGREGDRPIRVDEDCYALLPNDTVPPGKDMVYLARRRPRVEVREDGPVAP